jgi:hypothetical protein
MFKILKLYRDRKEMNRELAGIFKRLGADTDRIGALVPLAEEFATSSSAALLWSGASRAANKSRHVLERAAVQANVPSHQLGSMALAINACTPR